MHNSNSLQKIIFIATVFMILFSKSALAALYQDISELERMTVDEGLSLYGLEPHDDPTGKKIKKIYIYTKSPFSKEAGFLSVLDKLHVNTKKYVIRQYLFFKEEQIYDAAAIRDSEKSLRHQNLVRSLAVIIPVHRKDSSSKDSIDLLVATRDILSLRPSFNFQGNFDTITDFSVSLGEHNILGSNKSATAIYAMKQAMHIVSVKYFDPHLFGSPFELSVHPGLVFSRDRFKLDGFEGNFSIDRPLISETDKWGYGFKIRCGSKPIIDFNGNEIRRFDIPETVEVEEIERRYRWRYAKGSLHGRRSFGSTYKKELWTSYGFNVKRPSINKDMKLNEQEKESFQKHVLPKDEFESYVTFGFDYFQNQYLNLYDYNNFKLAENKRIGPDISLSIDFSSKNFLLSDTNFIRPISKFSYLLPFGSDSFGKLSVSTTNRYDGSFNDNTYRFGLSLVSPKILGLGRIIFDGRLSTALDNRDNKSFSLGADSGVRGVKSGFYKDAKAFRTNLEIRSAPVDLWITYVGFVLFYDVGAAFKEWDEANATHTLGFGIRVLTPQISSQVFRLDIGFPIFGPGQRQHVAVPSFGMGQAF